MTRGLEEANVVPRNRIELLTRGFSVQQECMLIEILDHLIALGRAADVLRESLETGSLV